MPYFKCVSYEGPILVCFISLENEKISLKWGPMEQKLVFSTLEKTDDDSCWYTAWPKETLFVLDHDDPVVFHETRKMYTEYMRKPGFKKEELTFVHSDEISHFVPTSYMDVVTTRGEYYCLGER